MIELESLFREGASALCLSRSKRSHHEFAGLSLMLDGFDQAACLFIRAPASCDTAFRLGGDYRLLRCASGGWLLHNRNSAAPSFWLPAPATLRRTSAQGHILEERAAELDGFDLDTSGVAITFGPISEGWTLDVVIWKLDDAAHIDELQILAPIETQGYFLLGSHTRYGQPADLYRHLIHGWVYEDRYAWPHKRRICSENDAHALHLVFSGLQRATNKRIYEILKTQLLLSVLSRQSEDGGFHHGEWTNGMESHYRLNASAMHLFLDVLQSAPDPTVIEAAKRLAGFLASARDDMTAGVWFLHDELERSPEAMNQAPFKWQPSRVLGKSPSNMLVLNTHLDTTIALDRFGKMCGVTSYQPLVESACKAAQTVLSMDSAAGLYRVLFYAIGLTLLPTDQARKLPLPLRALKRLAWKYLTPNLYRIKVIFPRLVMPNGYIDRNLALGSFAFHYLTINLMDLTRFWRRFKQAGVDELIAKAAYFIQTSGVRERWKELKYEQYALGFWAEALWHMCQQFPEHVEYRDWYEEACSDLQAMNMGLPPSHLCGNAEAIVTVGNLLPYSPRQGDHNTNMKIGLVAPFFLPEIGGANLYCYELARALGSLGHEVHVFSIPGALKDPAYHMHPILTRKLENDIPALLQHEMDVWHSLFFYYAPLALHHPKVFATVHGDDGFSFQLRYQLPKRDALTRTLLWRLPESLKSGAESVLKKLELTYNRKVYQKAVDKLAGIITVSSFTRDRFGEHYRGAVVKSTIIPPGVSERFFAPRSGHHPHTHLLTVTRLDEDDRIKNVHNVIAALGRLKDRYGFRYQIVSGTATGGYKAELEGMIRDFGLRDRVAIVGRKTDEELLDLYHDTGLFILVSYSEAKNFEGFGIVFLEANACGVPVLTSRDGGMRDYVVDGKNGIYVDTPDADGIEAALVRYFEGRDCFDTDAIRAKPEPYRWVHIAERVTSLYQARMTHNTRERTHAA